MDKAQKMHDSQKEEMEETRAVRPSPRAGKSKSARAKFLARRLFWRPVLIHSSFQQFRKIPLAILAFSVVLSHIV